MDFIDEKHVPRVQVAEDGSQVAGPFNGRAAGHADVLSHFRRDDAGEGGFAQAGRAVQQHMVQRVMTGKGGLDIDVQAAFHGLLAYIIPERMGAEGLLHRAVFRHIGSGHQSVIHHRLLLLLFLKSPPLHGARDESVPPACRSGP